MQPEQDGTLQRLLDGVCTSPTAAERERILGQIATTFIDWLRAEIERQIRNWNWPSIKPDPGDLVGDAWLAVAKRLNSNGQSRLGASGLKAYARTVIARDLSNHYCYMNRKKRNRTLEEPFEPDIVADTSSVPSKANKRELLPRLRAILARLHKDYSEVLYLKLFDSLSFEEIGLIQGVHASTAANRFYKGVTLARRLVKEMDAP